jgi:hypothetical protein
LVEESKNDTKTISTNDHSLEELNLNNTCNSLAKVLSKWVFKFEEYPWTKELMQKNYPCIFYHGNDEALLSEVEENINETLIACCQEALYYTV